MTQPTKEQFFAQYWGQEVLIWDIHKYSVTPETITWVDKMPKEMKPCLELHDLKNITGEDAKEVYEIIDKRKHQSILIEKTEGGIQLYGDDMNVVVNIGHDGTIVYYEYRHHIPEHKMERIHSLKAFQNLQSKGYALPFHSYSVDDLVKMGWVKLIEK